MTSFGMSPAALAGGCRKPRQIELVQNAPWVQQACLLPASSHLLCSEPVCSMGWPHWETQTSGFPSPGSLPLLRLNPQLLSLGWTVKKAERGRIDVFELWCWTRLLRVPWTARRSNQPILKEISPGSSLEGMMLKLKLQYFGHLMR